MNLFLRDYLSRHRLTIGYFFRMAHVRKFHKDIDPTDEEQAYHRYGTLPPYAVEFLKQLMEAPCAVTAEPKSLPTSKS